MSPEKSALLQMLTHGLSLTGWSILFIAGCLLEGALQTINKEADKIKGDQDNDYT